MVLSQLKTYINTYPQINYENVVNRLVSSEYISFDIFDTLLKRDVKHVQDVFFFVEKKWNEKNPNDQIKNFTKKRINAEKKAYEKYGKSTTIENIYEFLNVDTAVKNLEMKIEYDLNIANQPFLEIFKELIALKKKVYLISDMYLPKQVIKKMLDKAGFIGYQALFVSCEMSKDKISGDLFKYVIKHENINVRNLIHVGDSWKADWLGAKKIGLKTYHIPKYVVNIKKYTTKKSLLDDTIDSFINNRIENYEYDKYQKFGYQVFGPVLLGFIQWLNESLDENKKLYFLARDGYIVKLAYELLFSNQNSGTYLYGSRRAFKVPLLQYAQTLKEIAEVINLPSTYTADELLDAVGLAKYEIKHQLGSMVYTEFYFENIPELKQLIQNNLALIKKNSKLEGHNLLQYLKQVEFEGEINIVDIGWRGSMQAYLEEFTKLNQVNVKLHGLYVGLTADAQQYGINAQGYWFDMLKNTTDIDLATPFKGLLEFLFSANHGTTLYFENKTSLVEPKLAPYEYDGTHNLKIQGELLNSIRGAALQFIKDFKESGLNNNLIIDVKTAFNRLEDVGLKPTMVDVNYLGDFIFVDQNINALAKPKRLIYYMVHPKRLKYDLLASRWKIGFMKRLVKCPINYYYLYKMLK
ncbi:HAD family hydrolase [Periweissella beninensis]|uniref:HAD family hydrolase n=1 Tax=Periweissella beninensis TaxID=504936 RepID=UPI0021A49FC8|nr:HAD family hydrolase [Periweissella beninensis]MCT4396501.1 hypothetical protein [Periweissella beninensis]